MDSDPEGKTFDTLLQVDRADLTKGRVGDYERMTRESVTHNSEPHDQGMIVTPPGASRTR
jgi:hypothetical protein